MSFHRLSPRTLQAFTSSERPKGFAPSAPRASGATPTRSDRSDSGLTGLKLDPVQFS